MRVVVDTHINVLLVFCSCSSAKNQVFYVECPRCITIFEVITVFMKELVLKKGSVPLN